MLRGLTLIIRRPDTVTVDQYSFPLQATETGLEHLFEELAKRRHVPCRVYRALQSTSYWTIYALALFSSSWEDCKPQEKLKRMLMQNSLGGKQGVLWECQSSECHTYVRY